MLRKAFHIAALFLMLGASAQNKTQSETGSQAPMDLINEANKIAETDAAKSMQLATNALEKSIEQKDRSAEYYSYNTLGTLYYNIGNFTKAGSYFNLARNGFAALKNEKGKAYAEKYLALSLEKQKKYKEALEVDKGYDRSSAYRSKDELNKKKYERAKLKSKAGKKEEAISDLKTLAKDSSLSQEEKINIYKELGDLYVATRDTVKAYEAYNEALKKDNFTVGKGTYLNRGILDVAGKISELNLKTGKSNENYVFQNTLLLEGLKSKDPDLVQAANYNLGNTFLNQNEEYKAIPYLFTSAKIAKSRGNAQEERKSVKDLAKAYENLGQYDKALEIYKRYVRLSDSFQSLKAGNESEALALNREFLKQEARIKGLMNEQKEREDRIRRQWTLVWALAGGLFLFVILTWALIRNIRQKQKANRMIKLQSLRAQMNPHFIFNSLNSVNNFIAKNDERSANKYIADFSKLMRTVLKNSDQDFISLDMEIETLRIYLDLEYFRFGDKFEYTLEVAENVEPDQFQVPPMLIQPYLENAIWHGLRYLEGKGKLDLRFFIEDKKLYCTICDNGIGRKKSAELKTLHQKSYQSTGIKNTAERIALLNKLHKTSLKVQITDLEEEGQATGTLVRISLPFIRSAVEV